MTALRPAVRLIVCLGLVSLFADVTYEGARSISGPFLATLGASGTTVGLIAGTGELIAYGLRYVSGVLADRTRRYWTILFIGYGVNLAAVPLLALANNWQLAAFLLIMERFGKSIRGPSRDALLSAASQSVGQGWGFALHEAMDQIGALTGPLVVAGVLATRGSYPAAFAILAIPAVCALASLSYARTQYPASLEPAGSGRTLHLPSLPSSFWIYVAGSAVLSFGYLDFALMAFHAKKLGALPDTYIPVLYGAAMGIDAVAALALGWWYDRAPKAAILTGIALGWLTAPLVFLGGTWGFICGIALWGAGLGMQESVLRAGLTPLIPPTTKASAFGAFHSVNGVAWFAGSFLMGWLYEHSLPGLVAVSLIAQALAFVLFARRSEIR